MEFFKTDEFKSMMKDIIRETMEPFEKRIENRLKMLEELIDEKMTPPEEAEPVDPKILYYPPKPSFEEVDVAFQILKSQRSTTSFVVSPLAIALGVYPFYKEANVKTRKLIRKYLMSGATHQFMEQYFLDVVALSMQSGTSGSIQFDELNGMKSTLSIGSFFVNKPQTHIGPLGDVYTSPTTSRQQEFLNLPPIKCDYYEYDVFQMVKIEMKKDEHLCIYLPHKIYSPIDFMYQINAPNLTYAMRWSTQHSVEITIPVFSIRTETDLKRILKPMGIEEESFPHEAEFQISHSEVNISGGHPESTSSRQYSDSKGPIKFVANHPFIFVFTKSAHVTYMGCYT